MKLIDYLNKLIIFVLFIFNDKYIWIILFILFRATLTPIKLEYQLTSILTCTCMYNIVYGTYNLRIMSSLLNLGTIYQMIFYSINSKSYYLGSLTILQIMIIPYLNIYAIFDIFVIQHITIT